MKKTATGILLMIFFWVASLPALSQVNLPKVTVAGEQYYVYETGKGDSMYGIANHYGWNIDRLMALNPSLATKMKKGSKVYYPVDPEKTDDSSAPADFSAESYPVIQHLVKKGDSVYSIAKMYDVPVEKIYLYNPDTKNGLKRGEIVTIPQAADKINEGDSYFFYAIRPGDTLGSVAETYNTSVEQLLRDNKGVSNGNFEAGDLLRISVNSRQDSTMVQTVEEIRVDHIDTYKAKKNDTWESVAEKTGTDIEQLRDFNSGVELKKNAVIDVPVIVTSKVEKEVEYMDERENMAGGIDDIYNEVHKIGNADSVGGSRVSIALIIEDPQSKRDNEFTRGALLALDRLKNADHQIRFKVMPDRKADVDSVRAVKALADSLDRFGADVVIATHEKNFPLWLARYGDENGVEIVNAFDVRSELYLDNPAVINLLTPSGYLSDAVAEWVESSFPDSKMIFVGNKDADDAYADAIASRFGGSEYTSAAALGEKKLADWGKYVIYGYPSTRDDVSALLNAVVAMKEANPLASVKVIGRLSWITLADEMKELFGKAEVYFPSRFFFNHTGADEKKFIADYSASFGHGPIRAFPTYAVAGYDIMNFLINSLASNSGDFNVTVTGGRELQSPLNLERVGNWGGFFNPSSYIIHYPPYGDVEKILIRK